MNIKKVLFAELSILSVIGIGIGLFIFFSLRKNVVKINASPAILVKNNDLKDSLQENVVTKEKVINQITEATIALSPTLVPTSIPSPTSDVKPQIYAQISPDGTKMLYMKITKNQDLSKKYELMTGKTDETSLSLIYTITLADGTMDIPFNSWSPDNKYFFVNLTTSEQKNQSLIFKENGANFDENNSLNAYSIFSAREKEKKFDHATGWAGYSLLLVNSKNVFDQISSPFWLEVPSGNLIALSSGY